MSMGPAYLRLDDADAILDLMAELDAAIEKAAQFLVHAEIVSPSKGWPLYVGSQDVAHWGGTLDALRALARVNFLVRNDFITDALTSLIRAQKTDGGWGSWEIPSSNVETTCWVLLTLHQCNKSHTKAFHNGIGYLRAAKDALEPCWGAFIGADVRMYPTLLSAWAMSLADQQLSHDALSWALAKQNVDRGLGYRPGSPSIPSLTALFLVVAEAAQYLLPSQVYESQFGFLLASGTTERSWLGDLEDWICAKDPRTKKSIPTHTKHFSHAWICRALCRPGSPRFAREALQVGFSLLKNQKPDGSWLFSESDPKQYIWCTANGLVALADFRDWLADPVGRVALIRVLLSAGKIVDLQPVNKELVRLESAITPLQRVADSTITLPSALEATNRSLKQTRLLVLGSIALNICLFGFLFYKQGGPRGSLPSSKSVGNSCSPKSRRLAKGGRQYEVG